MSALVTAVSVPTPSTSLERPLRRVPAPETEPRAEPFDGRHWHGRAQPALAHAFLGVDQEPGRARLRVVSDPFGPQPTPRRGLPEPQAWTRRIVTAVLEVEAGARPAVQLARYLDDRVLSQVRGRARRATGAPASRVRSVRICEPDDGVVEASVVLTRGGRCTAVALRLEGLDGRWVCTAFEEPAAVGAAPLPLRNAG